MWLWYEQRKLGSLPIKTCDRSTETDLMEHDLIYGQTEIKKEMKVSYTPNILVDAGLPMGRRAQARRVPSPMGLNVAF